MPYEQTANVMRKKNDTAIKSDEVNRNWCGSKALRLLFVLSFSLQFYFIDASDKLFSEFLKLNFPSIRSSKSVTGISTFMYLIHSKTTTTTIILKYPFSEIHWKNKRKNMQKKKNENDGEKYICSSCSVESRMPTAVWLLYMRHSARTNGNA